MKNLLYTITLLFACAAYGQGLYAGETDEGIKISTLIIDSVQFANIDKRGRVIDDYGERIEGRWVKYLALRVSCRTLVPNSVTTLDVKFFNPQGKLMRDNNSPDDCSLRVTIKTGAESGNHQQYLGKLKSKFGKGYRMEIYDGQVRLATSRVPTRGWVTYVPIMVQTNTHRIVTDEFRRYLKMSQERRSILHRQLHSRNYTGPFMDYYIITGWRAVEK